MSRSGHFLLAALMLSTWGFSARAQQAAIAEPLITTQIDNSVRTTLAGNTRPEASTATDLGAVADSRPMSHMQLLLKRPPGIEAAFAQTVASLYDPTSPTFHHWLSPSDVGRFGLARSDIGEITAWLAREGFEINNVYDSGVLIDFSGTAGQVRAAFHTEIHALDVAGAKHIANVSNPEIPAALAPAVEGIVALHDFSPHPAFVPISAYTTSSGAEVVTPADLAVIYNLNAAFEYGLSGQGQTVAVMEDTDTYGHGDWQTFRNKLGLAEFTDGNLVTVHPKPSMGANNCAEPGLNDDEPEATLDAEWASASAPSATIEIASCANTATDGQLIALNNLLSQADHPSIVSISYGQCEVVNGAAKNAAYNAAYEQAAAEGVSVFVAAGDWSASTCDVNDSTLSTATHGVNVNGLGSTIYNVAVGGTDFADTYYNDTDYYWKTYNQGGVFESARSYIPEIPWNDSCASPLLAAAHGFDVSYGANGFCNSPEGQNFLSIIGGGGGPSGCAKGAATIDSVVSGTCAGYAKPGWQQSLTNASKKVRELPDVSLFAGNDVWNHYYVYCDSSSYTHLACDGAPSTWAGAGGTSFASPIMAGIQALVNQYNGAQGNPNPVYYALAEMSYNSGKCQSLNKKAPSSECIFYDIVRGSNEVNCTGDYNCYLPSGTNGVLSTQDSTFVPAFNAGLGWNYATGLGSVNATNLIADWSKGMAPTSRTNAAAPR